MSKGRRAGRRGGGGGGLGANVELREKTEMI